MYRKDYGDILIDVRRADYARRPQPISHLLHLHYHTPTTHSGSGTQIGSHST